MTLAVERPLVLELDDPTGPRPRPAAGEATGTAEIVAIAPGVWAVCVFGLIPKNGFDGIHFPHYWSRRGDGSMWQVARHGEVPDGSFVFTSEAEAREVVAEAFDGETNLRPFMGWISIPSDDYRMTAADRRAPRKQRPRTTGSEADGEDCQWCGLPQNGEQHGERIQAGACWPARAPILIRGDVPGRSHRRQGRTRRMAGGSQEDLSAVDRG